MRDTLVARNYAEALLAVAAKEQAVERYGELLDVVAGIVKADPTVHTVLMSPRVAKSGKQRMIAQALQEVSPASFVRFLQAVIHRGRQGLLGAMSEAYQELADRHFNRAHAGVVTAHAVDDALGRIITERLTAAVGKTVVPHFRTDPAILGGVVVRVGDRAFDGSIRRRIQLLRSRMLHSPGGAARP